MGGLVAMLSTSQSALQADQSALDVTANNVANQNTVGYTREVVNFQTDSVTLGSATANGVNTGSGPVSVRDRVLEQQVQTQTESQSASMMASMQQIENIFSLSSTATTASSTPLGSANDAFFSSLTALASNPADTSTRQDVLSAASSLASAFNSAANQVAQIGSGLNAQVTSVVGEVNGLTTQIAGLNTQIAELSPKADAGTLEDQRQAAIAQLSQYIGMNQMTTENNGMTLTTTGGQVLVSGSSAYALGTTQVGGVTDVVGQPNGNNVTGEITGGQLGGVLQARDTELPAVLSALDTMANGIATQVNAVNEQGVNGSGAAGQAIFSVAGGVAGSAASITVIASGPDSLASAATGEGSAGNTNAQALANLSTANIVSGTSPAGFYASLLDTIGNTAANATAENTQQQASLTQVTTQRNALSGVSLDEEAANLTTYQRAYEAASQVFTIVNTLMASAINLGVETAVS